MNNMAMVNAIIDNLCGRSGFDAAFDVDDNILESIKQEMADAIDAHIAGMGKHDRPFTPDWAGYRQGLLDGRAEFAEGSAPGQSLGMVVYHGDEVKAAALEGRRVLIVPDDSTAPPIDLAAVREVIATLRTASRDSLSTAAKSWLTGMVDQLEAAIKGVA